jgi:hypothetical protein
MDTGYAPHARSVLCARGRPPAREGFSNTFSVSFVKDEELRAPPPPSLWLQHLTFALPHVPPLTSPLLLRPLHIIPCSHCSRAFCITLPNRPAAAAAIEEKRHSHKAL